MRRRLARWLDPSPPAAPGPPALPAAPQPTRPVETWPELCEQFALRILGVAYDNAGRLSAAARDEEDPGRLELLYSFDHANARIRRQAENLLVLAGRQVEDAGRQTAPIIDVIRAAVSAIDHYARVHLGAVVNLAVVDVASDDVIRVLTELLDNATRYSAPSTTVSISAHLTETGSVLIRVQDMGIGISPDLLGAYNAALDGHAPAGRGTNTMQLGLQVVYRLIRNHQMRVQLTQREGGGTTATVLLHQAMLTELPPSSPRPPTPVLAEPVSAPAPRPPAAPVSAVATPVTAVPAPVTGAPAPVVPAPAVPPPAVPAPAPVPPVPPPGPAPRPAGPAARPHLSLVSADANGLRPPVPRLPRREPGSLRDATPPRPEKPPLVVPPSDPSQWPDETMEFVAGFEEGQR
jgi:anti-sigma regulatory factor (Ser/Thr protein kinase)